MDLTPFKTLIKERCGLVFDNPRGANLEAGITSRMAVNRLKFPAEYYKYLVYEEEEFLYLVNLITINETYFFREFHHYRICVDHFFPELLKKKNRGTKIRILNAGCSTGEEPYSLLIALIERYGPGIEKFCSVTGIDIDMEAIKTAKRGIFSSKSFRDFPDGLKEKYFKEAGNGLYEVSDIVRQGVMFQEFNLVRDLYPDMLRHMDIIFYRNVSIYFDSETREKILRNLFEILNNEGYLILSSTETLSHNINIFSLTEVDGIFFYKKNIDLNTDDEKKSYPFVPA
ncbi:MAG: protein-glutamate O-methyltransferase CheR [Desulfobacterales bacterium]|nr:protein-glutamate O-methyltransferase CheR [Desulfobacterales bacterium]